MSLALKGSLVNNQVHDSLAQPLASHSQDPSQRACLPWDGKDSYGREVCKYSFNTKQAGCHNPCDRINIENDLRPQYASYINLNTRGIRGDEYKGVTQYDSAGNATKHYDSRRDIVGAASLDQKSHIRMLDANVNKRRRDAGNVANNIRGSWNQSSAGMNGQESYKRGNGRIRNY